MHGQKVQLLPTVCKTLEHENEITNFCNFAAEIQGGTA